MEKQIEIKAQVPWWMWVGIIGGWCYVTTFAIGFLIGFVQGLTA